MEYIQNGFNIKYEIKPSSTLRTTGAGVLQNGSAYSSSLKIFSRNSFEVFNEKTNFYDTKEICIAFKIICNSDSETLIIANKFREYFKKNLSISLDGSVANFHNNEYQVNILNSYDDILKILDGSKSK